MNKKNLWVLNYVASVCFFLAAIIGFTTKGEAALNVSVFCIGMLITYYITAELTNTVYRGCGEAKMIVRIRK